VFKNNLNAVFFGSEADNSELFKSFIEVAKVDEKYKFYHVLDRCDAYHGPQGEISIFRLFDKSPVVY
jgi:hypothetical protein